MAHESFEDEHVAAFMNEHFVNIKVDREERPDIDAIYMRATTAMTGNGGWPMTCILTPDGQPFFTGTYFPPEPRPNHPAFSQILQALAEAWRDRRAEVLESADSITAYLNEATLAESGSLTDAVLDTAAAELLKQADRHNGGFGGAPKFPPTMALEFLSRHAARTRNAEAFAVVDQTFETMARSGLNDQLGGGFARYSVDARWDVPHFEKMLYDNSLLTHHPPTRTGESCHIEMAHVIVVFHARSVRESRHAPHSPTQTHTWLDVGLPARTAGTPARPLHHRITPCR